MLKPEGRRLLPCEQANLNYSLLTSCVCPSCHYNSIAESGAACLTVLFYVLHLKGETFQEEPMTENYICCLIITHRGWRWLWTWSSSSTLPVHGQVCVMDKSVKT